MELVILSDPTRRRATVAAASDYRTVPAGMLGHVVAPGESYRGVPYPEWRQRLGTTVELPWHPSGHRYPEVAPQPAAPPGDWRPDPEITGEPLPGSPYGYHSGTHLLGCSREELIERCVGVPGTPAVWTPEAPGVVRPEDVPFLVEACRLRRVRDARRASALAALLLLAALGTYAVWNPRLGFRSALVLVPAFLAFLLVDACACWVAAEKQGPEVFPRVRQAVRHQEWIERQPGVYTRWLVGAICVVALFQLPGTERSVAAAGLVKPAVWRGEVWRLLTGPMLHGGFVHLWMNVGALRSAGPVIELHSKRAHLPAVFVVSAVAGSLGSMILYPHQPSVGASGGIMGMIGFLLVLGHRRRHALPEGYANHLAVSILSIAALGLVGHAVIDNGAHLGGLLAGMLLGRRLTRRDAEEVETRRDRYLGAAATGVVAAAAIGSILAIVLHPWGP